MKKPSFLELYQFVFLDVLSDLLEDDLRKIELRYNYEILLEMANAHGFFYAFPEYKPFFDNFFSEKYPYFAKFKQIKNFSFNENVNILVSNNAKISRNIFDGLIYEENFFTNIFESKFSFEIVEGTGNVDTQRFIIPNLIKQNLACWEKPKCLIILCNIPMALLDVKADDIFFFYENEAGEIECKREFGERYMDISTIYLKYFTNKITNDYLYNDLKTYNDVLLKQLLIKDDKSEEFKESSGEYKQLSEQLQRIYLGNPMVDIRYRKFLQFIKKYPHLDIQSPTEGMIHNNWEFPEKEWEEFLSELI